MQETEFISSAIQSSNVLVPNPSQFDSVVWLLNAHGFSIKSAWDNIREVKLDVTWWKVVWFKAHIPRWAIIQWLAVHGRLATKDRLQNWGLVPNTLCVLCSASLESHLHLFFMCPYSSYIVGQLLRICGYRRGLISLNQEIDWASRHMTGNGLQQSLYKMVLAASLYHIWLERNKRVFQGSQRDALSLVSVVKADIRSCLSLWRKVKRSARMVLSLVCLGK
ncbi:hypothetical protein RHGRI_027563 [Rhododendron griersonianum]|uniref:Reverse transcriptase zinc-binding domain-containing protein n=2 Tax=Rhododendron griersonianum TaxID=479676 RepID=A0AAV6J220_9ERIC|nr:hypothetical protein RHGRI_027563 [Rhododendron griersonianum]